MTSKATSALPQGTVVSGYRVEGELGRGAMAVVYRAIQLNLERTVALKILTAELAANEEFVVRFFNEARAAAQLTHPSIIQAYDAGIADDDTYYFAMEYVEGETLHERITREGHLRTPDALAVAADIADALDYGWQRQRLTHGDIKPENIMVNKLGETKLADFGLAKVTGHDFEGTDILLTPLYGAPELIRGQRVKDDCRGDIYSFGATMYHMLTGAPPFPGENAHEVMQRHLNEEPVPASQRVPSIPKEVSVYVDSLLSKSPEGRPTDWHAVKQSLRGLRKLGGRRVLKRSASPVASAAARVAAEKVQQVHDVARNSSAQRRAGPLMLLAVGLCLSSIVLLILLARAAATRRQNREALPPVVHHVAASPAAEAEWAALSNRLPKISDPAEAVALLDAFGQKYGQDVPPAYTDSSSRWHDTLKWREAAKAADIPLSDDDTGQPEASSSDVTALGGGERDPAAVVAEVNALNNERGTAPVPARRLASLENTPARLEEDGGPTGGADGPLGEDAVPMADSYTDLLAELARFRYQFGADFEPLVRRAKEWLLKHDGESHERRNVSFITDTVIPSISELQAALVLHKGDLIGERIPGRKFTKEGKIKTLDINEIQLEKETQYGLALRKVRWEELDDPRYFIYMAKPVLGGESLPLEERRSYLALLLVTRSFKLWDEALVGVPETPEKRLWMALKGELTSAESEGEALALWRRARVLLGNSEYVAAFTCLRQLRASRTAVAFRYREQIENFVRDCEGHVPENIAGQLVRDAQGQDVADPLAALAMLRRAVVQYGRVDYPERASIHRIRDQIIQGLPRGDWTEKLAEAPASALRGMWFFPAEPTMDVGAMVVCQELNKLADLPGEAKLGLPAFEAIAVFLLGDWGKARELLVGDALKPTKHLPNTFQAAVWFVRGLLADRFEDRSVASEDVLAGLRELLADMPRRPHRPRFRHQIGSLAVEYAIVASGQDIKGDDAIFWDELFPKAGAVESERFILDALSLRVERGEVAEARALLEEVASDDGRAHQYGFGGERLTFLQSVGTQLAGENGLRAPRFVREAHRAQYMRLALSTALRSPKNSDAAAVIALVCDDLGTMASDATPLNGTVCFDAICCLAAAALGEGDLTAAVAAIDRGIGMNSAALAPYFPRLCFLKAGLVALAGDVGKAQETLGAVMASSVSGKTERTLTRTWDKDPQFRIRDLSKNRPDAMFWYGWLHFCRSVGESESKSPGKSFKQVAEHAPSLALRYMCLSAGALGDERSRE